MPGLFNYLTSQPVFKIIGGLLLSSRPRHLRELAKEYDISASGVSDILRRLKDCGVLKEKREGNRRYLSLSLSSSERESLERLFNEAENQRLRERAIRFSKNAEKKLEWMDEAYKFMRQVKKRGVGKK